MKRPIFKPRDFECTLEQCPPGFFIKGEMIGLKSEYCSSDGFIEAYCDSGEYFWGGVDSKIERNKVMVTPLYYEWEEV